MDGGRNVSAETLREVNTSMAVQTRQVRYARFTRAGDS